VRAIALHSLSPPHRLKFPPCRPAPSSKRSCKHAHAGPAARTSPQSIAYAALRHASAKSLELHSKLLTFTKQICESDSMKLRISATKAARSFSELMNRVRYRGESFVVERGGKPICEILPAGPPKFSGRELASLLRSLPKPDAEYLAAVEDLVTNQSTVAKSAWPH
jgi:antitoxin (DNA-binding transcriptional repressor) of toxin-antitoxin stability system